MYWSCVFHIILDKFKVDFCTLALAKGGSKLEAATTVLARHPQVNYVLINNEYRPLFRLAQQFFLFLFISKDKYIEKEAPT